MLAAVHEPSGAWTIKGAVMIRAVASSRGCCDAFATGVAAASAATVWTVTSHSCRSKPNDNPKAQRLRPHCAQALGLRRETVLAERNQHVGNRPYRRAASQGEKRTFNAKMRVPAAAGEGV